MAITRIESIADHLDLISTIGKWHWDEWGAADPSGSLEQWTKGLRERTKRDEIPTTYIALSETGTLLGSVTLVEHDMDTHPELSPWLAGLYADPPARHQGVGSSLVCHAQMKARVMGVDILYLYSSTATDLYRRLGWQIMFEEFYEGAEVTVMRFVA